MFHLSQSKPISFTYFQHLLETMEIEIGSHDDTMDPFSLLIRPVLLSYVQPPPSPTPSLPHRHSITREKKKPLLSPACGKQTFPAKKQSNQFRQYTPSLACRRFNTLTDKSHVLTLSPAVPGGPGTPVSPGEPYTENTKKKAWRLIKYNIK